MAKPSGNNSVPEWVGAEQGVPDANKRQIGWVTGERPTAGMFNWFWKTVSMWLSYLNVWTTNHNHEGTSADGSSKKIKLDKELDMTVVGTGTAHGRLKVTVNSLSNHTIEHSHTGGGAATIITAYLQATNTISARTLQVTDGDVDLQAGGLFNVYKTTTFHQTVGFDRFTVANDAQFASAIQVNQGINYGSAASRVEVKSAFLAVGWRELDFKVGGTDPGNTNNVQIKTGSVRLKTASPIVPNGNYEHTLYQDNLTKATGKLVFKKDLTTSRPYVSSFSGYNIASVTRVDSNHQAVQLATNAIGWKVELKEPASIKTFTSGVTFDSSNGTTGVTPAEGLVIPRIQDVTFNAQAKVIYFIVSATFLDPNVNDPQTVIGSMFKNLPNSTFDTAAPPSIHFQCV